MSKMFVANKALLVNDEGKILLIRDAGRGDHKTVNGFWDVPGGRMETHELAHEGLIREVKEEISFDIRPFLAKPIYVDKWGVKQDIQNQPIIGIFWLVSITDISVILSSEHSEHMWADLQTLPTPLLPPLERALTFMKTHYSIS